MKEKIKLIIMIVLFIGIILGINYYINYKSKEKIFNIEDSTEKAIVEFTQETVNDNNKNNEYYEMAKANVSKNKVENIIENKIEDLAENIISNNAENLIENNISSNTSSNTINEIVYANENTFYEEVYKEERIVIVDFYADWCSPCKMLGPILESIAKERKDIKIVKVNVDENSKLANEFRAYLIPLLVFFEDGKEVNRVAGLSSKEFILDLADKEVE